LFSGKEYVSGFTLGYRNTGAGGRRGGSRLRYPSPRCSSGDWVVGFIRFGVFLKITIVDLCGEVLMLMLGAGFINRFRTRVNRTRTGFSNNYGWSIIGGTWNIVARFRSFIGRSLS